MKSRSNQSSRCLIEKYLISKIDDDPRDEIINNTTASQMQDWYNKTEKALLKNYRIKRKEYLSSLTAHQQTSTTRKPIASNPKIQYNNDKRKKWNPNRLTELSKPKMDYYEYTEEIVTTTRHFRQVNIARINDLAVPRRTASNIDQTHKCKHCKVPLSALLPSIERLTIAPKRTDESEHIKTDEDTFSVKKAALKYVATERLKRLAIPRPSFQGDDDC